MLCGVQLLVPLFQASDCPLAGALAETGRPCSRATVLAPGVPVTSPVKVPAESSVQEF